MRRSPRGGYAPGAALTQSALTMNRLTQQRRSLRRTGPASVRSAVLAAYRQLPRSTRLHVRVRWHSAPLVAVAAAVPPQGRILDVGCGHGVVSLLLAAQSPARQIHGVDVDEAKIFEARQAADTLQVSLGTTDPASFETVPAGWRPPAGPHWDAIVVCDVLYLLGPEAAVGLVRACAAALAPGGALVVKEISDRPRWKYRLAVLQELAATKLTKVTVGETVRFVSAQQLATAMSDAGLQTTQRRIDRGYPHPHLLSVGVAR